MSARSNTTACLLAFGVAATGAVPAAAAAAPPATTIATLHGENEVRAWNGVQAWTDYDPADGRWHVVVRAAGRISTPAAIPAGDERLKVDVGRGPDGNPALAFVSCTDVCRVVVSAVDGSRAQPVPGSERASSPTIWGSRVAWVRGAQTVLTRRLGAGGVTRLAGVPPRVCYVPLVRRRCEHPGAGSVGSLELSGARLALIDNYALSQGGGNGQTEVRMESVRGGRQRLVALMNVGEGGQTFVGPAWANGRLYFYQSCPCGNAAGPYRYDPASGRYAKAPRAGALGGFAMDDDGRRAFETRDFAPTIGTRGDFTDVLTPLRLTGPLTFTRTRSPIATPGGG